MARREGLEPPTFWSVARCSIQLSYRRSQGKRILPQVALCFKARPPFCLPRLNDAEGKKGPGRRSGLVRSMLRCRNKEEMWTRFSKSRICASATETTWRWTTSVFRSPAARSSGSSGPNGAGKTTTIRMIMRIIASDSGTVLLDGVPVDDDRRRIIGYLPEERGLYKKMKVLEHLVFLGTIRGLRPGEAKKREPRRGSSDSSSTSGRPTRWRICRRGCSRRSSSSAPSSTSRRC